MKFLKTLAVTATIAASAVAGNAEAQKMQFFRIASGSAGGTYFPMAGLLAQVISNPPGARTCAKGGNCGMENLVAIAQSAHGSVANVNSIKSDQVESGFAQSDVTFWAYSGSGPFKGKKPIKKLCVLASLYPEHVHVVSGKDRGIKSVNDARVGDTIVSARETEDVEPLSGYQEPVPVVYCGLFPTETVQYQLLRESLEKLQLGAADWVLCLEVAEHIPRAFEERLLANLDSHNRRGIVMSWLA